MMGVMTPSQLKMETHPYEAGKAEATEQIVALIYDRYLFHRTFHGKDSELALAHKNLIHTIRDAQAEEMENENE
jgi:hypothetical protein